MSYQNTNTKFVLLLLVAAFTLRLAAVFVLAEDGSPQLSGDQTSYDHYALRIIEGGWFDKPVSFREPGFPFLLALVYKIFGQNYTAGRILNALISTFICLLIYVIANRVFGRTVAAFASIWSVFYYHFIYYSVFILRDILITFLFSAFILLLIISRERIRSMPVIISAIIYTFLIHTDARFIVYVPFILAYLFLFSKNAKINFRQPLLFLIVFIVMMIPWQIRNYIAYDKFVLINTRTLVYTPAGEGESAKWEGAFVSKPSTINQQGAEVRQLSTARRSLYEITQFYRIYRFKGEVRPGTDNFLPPWSKQHNVSSILCYGTIVIFFIFGYIRIVQGRFRRAYVLMMPFIVHSFIHLVRHGLPRYRVPIEPILIIVAFYGVCQAFEIFKRQRNHPTKTSAE
jgi:4-amino-4-deoxy-L-arabinose transferase-like glycosyltransferase